MAGTVGSNFNVSAMLDSLGEMTIRDSKYEKGAANLEGSLYMHQWTHKSEMSDASEEFVQVSAEAFPDSFIKDAADGIVTIGGKDYYLQDDGTWADDAGNEVRFVMSDDGEISAESPQNPLFGNGEPEELKERARPLI